MLKTHSLVQAIEISKASLIGIGRLSLHCAFYLSTVFVVVGQSCQKSIAILAKGAHSIFKCSGLLHHCAQWLVQDQSRFASTHAASSWDIEIEGTFCITSVIGRAEHSA